jgi:hypothetical protein
MDDNDEETLDCGCPEDTYDLAGGGLGGTAEES